MERRRARRYVRRLRVHLEVPPPGPPVAGTTVNLSLSGALIRATRPLPQGTRVRAVLQEQAYGAVFEAKVVRHVTARSLEDEALAIRFLMPSEVLAELVPQVDWRADSLGTSAVEPGPGAPPAAEPEAESGPRVWTLSEAELESVARPAGGDEQTWFEPGLSPFDSNTGAVIARPVDAPTSAPEPVVHPDHDFRVTIRDAADLRRRYQEELRYGGLFVHASSPPDRDKRVVVLIDLPWAGVPALLVRGRVVHQVPSPPDQAGFALEFDSRERFLEELKPILEAR